MNVKVSDSINAYMFQDPQRYQSNQRCFDDLDEDIIQYASAETNRENRDGPQEGEGQKIHVNDFDKHEEIKEQT